MTTAKDISKHFRDRKSRNGHRQNSSKLLKFLNTLGRF